MKGLLQYLKLCYHYANWKVIIRNKNLLDYLIFPWKTCKLGLRLEEYHD
jgi:hypothetical protein